MKITVAGFSGANKALDPKFLPDAVGADSQNHKPGRGDLRPWKQPLTVATVPGGAQTIYRFGRDTASDVHYWFSWNAVVHAVRGYNSGDTTERTYYTGDGVPKWTNNVIGLANAPYPTAYRQLGVPQPTTAVTLTASGGSSSIIETRFYTYTYVTDIGEESAPAPVSLAINCKSDDTITIDSIATPPSGAWVISTIRVYRTESGQSATDFYFLREESASTTTTTDDNRALGEPLQTTTWITPPADLTNLTAMWNGMLAGVTSTGAVRICEPFAPYAWPDSYEIIPPDASAKALGRWQQNLLVLTSARPLLVNGSSPDSLDQQPLDFAEPVVAPRAVVSFGHGVAWPSPNGLAYYNADGGRFITAGIFTRDDWQAMNPAGMVAGAYMGGYLCFYTDGGGARRGFFIDPINPTGVYFLSQGYDGLYFDELQETLYVLNGTSVQKWDAGASFMTATFQSKVFVTLGVNFAAARVRATVFPATLRIDAGPFEPADQTAILAARSMLSAVGKFLRYSVTVNDDKPVRLPSGFLASDWQVQVETVGAVESVTLATSMRETA